MRQKNHTAADFFDELDYRLMLAADWMCLTDMEFVLIKSHQQRRKEDRNIAAFMGAVL